MGDRKHERMLWAMMGVQERHLKAVYDVEPDETDALTVVKKWLASGKSLLVLSGGPGVGKSAAAAWAVTQLTGLLNHLPTLSLMKRVGFVVKATMLQRAFGFSEEELIAREWFASTPFLIVEELGMEYDGKGFFQAEFSSFMDDRHGAELRTIITTNSSIEEFKNKHPRLADRAKESGGFATIGGESLRDLKAREEARQVLKKAGW